MKKYTFRLVAASCIMAVLVGFSAIILHEVLLLTQTFAFGHTEETATFVTDGTSPSRRFLVLVIVGVFSAVVWYFLQSGNRRIVSIKAQVKSDTKDSERPIFWAHVLHVLTQIVAVGAGAPVGKETAPRELGALTAGRLAERFKLMLPDHRLLVACGAGAGLAAVYQVPLASAFFVFETLGIAVSLKNLLMVTLSTFLAAQVAQLAISTEPLYTVGHLSLTFQNALLAVLLGFIIAPVASLFARWTKKVTTERIKDRRILWCLPLSLGVVGLFAIFFPQLLGNGSEMAQLIFKGTTISYATCLLLLKAFLVLLVLKNGAYGGTLTPSFAMGGICGLLFASALQLIFPTVQTDALMLIGAASFLTVTLQAPITALSLVVSFTGQNLSALPILLIAVITAYSSQYYLIKQK